MWVQSLGQEDPCRRKWQPTSVLLPGKSHRQRSLAGYSLCSRKELDTTEQLNNSNKKCRIIDTQNWNRVYFCHHYPQEITYLLQGGSTVKNLPAKAGNAGDMGLIPRLRRSPGEGNGNPLQYYCLGNPMDRGAWRARVHGVAKESDMTYRLNNSNNRFKT